MQSTSASIIEQISDAGFAVVPGVFNFDECQHFASELQVLLLACNDEQTSLRRANGVIYGARNLLEVFPAATMLWRRPPLIELLQTVLGPQFGLVRGLYFDKPPDSTWSLPWHQDLTIAVQSHSLPSEHFRKCTVKAGVPHVEAPDEILRQMLTLRIHLDDVTEENGPLQVLPGTHISRSAAAPRPPVSVLAAAGDVLAMRPLLSHSSGVSHPETNRHRRVIHLEFASSRELPDGYRWHRYLSM